MLHVRRMHPHLIAQGIAFQLKGAGRRHHARIIIQDFAHKTDSEHAIQGFDRTDQYLSAPANLDVDQSQIVVLESADETALPMGREIYALPPS